MTTTLAAIPAIPLLSALLLVFAGGALSRRLVAVLGAGSIGVAALLVASVVTAFLSDGEVRTGELWTWMSIGDLHVRVAFHIDGLTVVMMSVITGVGFLIHLFSIEFMEDDEAFTRFFAYMNLFVGAMLILVMADNLLLLFLGWEGVGMCSYLLVGFWYQKPENGAAARKAFIVTRVGDACMALGLFLLFTELGTLEIGGIVATAQSEWAAGSVLPVLACSLLLAGALGKSAQLPLHTWLPDAMAGPTPVSALIHAATMVTAGVYLIARLHGLFLLAPAVLELVAWIGVATVLLAASAALVQTDIKRILAYSTISQIGYMFLGLGVGAFSYSVFHLMTHAFFKALLFLSAGAVTHCLHHEHNIFRMGGLRERLPTVFIGFLVGSAALAALPLTSGFYSKDGILLAAYAHAGSGPALWLLALLGAVMTAFYSFRLLFTAFFGPVQLQPDRSPGVLMRGPLLLLSLLALFGGAIQQPLDAALPPRVHPHLPLLIEGLSIGLPLLGLIGAWYLFVYRRGQRPAFGETAGEKGVGVLLRRAWCFDSFYNALLVRPYLALARGLRGEPVDGFYAVLIALSRTGHRVLSSLQNGELRWYAMTFALGLFGALAIALRFVS